MVGRKIQIVYYDTQEGKTSHNIHNYADMAELADVLDLGSSALQRVGSNPTIRTIYERVDKLVKSAYS